MIDAVILSLTLHGLSFFAVSPKEARAMAIRAVELSSPTDDEADLVHLYSLIWRANRDARRFRDGSHNMPVHHVIKGDLPAEFLIEEQPKATAYSHLYIEPEFNLLEDYPIQLPEWREQELEEMRSQQPHPHGHPPHHDHPPAPASAELRGHHRVDLA